MVERIAKASKVPVNIYSEAKKEREVQVSSVDQDSEAEERT